MQKVLDLPVIVSGSIYFWAFLAFLHASPNGKEPPLTGKSSSP